MCWIHSVSLFDRMAVLHGMDNLSSRQNQCFPSQLFSLLFQRILPPSSGSMGECAPWCHRKLTPAPCHARHAPPHLMQSPFSGVTCAYNCIFRYSPSLNGNYSMAWVPLHCNSWTAQWSWSSRLGAFSPNALVILLFCASTHFCASFLWLSNALDWGASYKMALDWFNCFI